MDFPNRAGWEAVQGGQGEVWGDADPAFQGLLPPGGHRADQGVGNRGWEAGENLTIVDMLCVQY